MRTLIPVFRMVFQRSVGHWRVLSTLIIGTVLSAALMACVVLYSDAIRDLGLDHALSSQPARAIDLEVDGSAPSLLTTDYGARKTGVDGLLQNHSRGILSKVIHYGRSETFFMAPAGQPLPTEDDKLPRAHIQFQDDLAAHTRIVEGRAPGVAQQADDGGLPVVELALAKATADKFGVKVGDTFDFSLHWRKGVVFKALVVGTIEPLNQSEAYWFGKTDRFDVTTTRWPTYPFFMDEATFLQVMTPIVPELDVNYETYGLVDTSRINSSNERPVEDSIRALERDVPGQVSGASLKTELGNVLQNYREKLFFTRLPLFALMLQIVGIVLFFVVMMATMVVERQTGEIALLRSRGAGTRQIMTIYLIEGTGLVVLATVVGPLLAVGAIALLGYTPPFNDLSGGSALSVSLTPAAFGLALFGALLALVALLWPAYLACRFSITNYKQQLSRPKRQPVFLRFYLDLVLIAIGAFLFYQLRQRGSLVTEKLFGDLSADPLMLVTPTLFMLMVALVFLRLFPLALRLGLWLSRTLKGPTLSMSLTRMARSPLQHSRLILLLILTTAVGMFAAGFRATLEKGYNDRSAYAAGAPTRLMDIRSPSYMTSDSLVKTVSEVTGASQVGPVARLTGSISVARYRSDSVQVLGIRPPDLASLGFWRDDFAGPSRDDLLARLGPGPAKPAETPSIPVAAKSIGVWARMPLPPRTPNPQLGMRFVDDDGRYWEYSLFSDNTTLGSWQFFSQSLANPSLPRSITSGQRPSPTTPLTFDSLFVRFPGLGGESNDQVTMTFDDLQWSPSPIARGMGATGFSDGTVFEPLDSLDRYETVAGVSQIGQPATLASGEAGAGRTGPAAKVTFIRGRAGASIVGLRRAVDHRPLPVLASKKALDRLKKKNGDEITIYVNAQYVDVKVVGVFDLFPGYDPDNDPGLFVADLATLQAAATRAPGVADTVYPGEAWLAGAPSGLTKTGLQEKGLLVDRILDRAEIHAQQAADPLVAASWEGILFLSFGAVMLISALAFVAYGSMSAQTRSLEFAVLRTMGFSGRQILGVVTFEQAFVITAGIIAGTLLGFPLSRLMIGYMGLTEHGVKPLPPLVSRVSWQAILTVYVSLAVAVTVTVVSLVVLYSRLAVGRALRMGEL